MLRAARQRRIHARDEALELGHVVLEELSRRVVRNLSVVTDQAILEMDPTYVNAHQHLGNLLNRMKNTTEAIDHLTRAIALDPKRAQTYLFLGLTYYQAGNHEKAVEVFKQGISNDPKNPELYFNIGAVYDKMNRFNDLVAAMENTIRLNPKHANALNYLGYTYVDRGIKLQEALDLINRALTVKPDDGYYIDSLGWAHYKMGNIDEALTQLGRAVALVPDDAVIQEHIGEIYLKKSLLREAKEAWLRSLELDPENKKLSDQYKAAGFGDPAQEDRIQKARLRDLKSLPSETESGQEATTERSPSLVH